MKVKEEVINRVLCFYSDNILQDIFDGYLKTEDLLSCDEDVKRVSDAMLVIENYVASISEYIEEM